MRKLAQAAWTLATDAATDADANFDSPPAPRRKSLLGPPVDEEGRILSWTSVVLVFVGFTSGFLGGQYPTVLALLGLRFRYITLCGSGWIRMLALWGSGWMRMLAQ